MQVNGKVRDRFEVAGGPARGRAVARAKASRARAGAPGRQADPRSRRRAATSSSTSSSADRAVPARSDDWRSASRRTLRHRSATDTQQFGDRLIGGEEEWRPPGRAGGPCPAGPWPLWTHWQTGGRITARGTRHPRSGVRQSCVCARGATRSSSGPRATARPTLPVSSSRRHWPGAWRAAYAVTGRRALADDVAQDAFERAFARPRALRRAAAVRALAAPDRRQPLARPPPLRARLVGADAAREAAEWDDPRLGDRALLEAVSALSEQRRVVVVLRYGLGYAPAAIAELLDLPAGTVHSRLARALEELRAHVEVSDVPRA